MMTKRDRPQPAEPASDEEPQVYAVRRDREGITFSRRDFLVVATAAAAATGVSGCGEVAPAPTPTAPPTAQLTPLPTLSPQQASEACKSIRAHRDSVEALAISPDGKLLASGGGPYDTTIKLWSLPDGALQATLTGHKGLVGALAISPDGKLLASGGGDKTIKLWSLPDGALQATLAGDPYVVNALAIRPNGKLLASGGSGDTIKLWSLPDGMLKTTQRGSSLALAISPDGKLLAAGGFDTTIKLWSLPDVALQATLTGHAERILELKISRDGRWLASGSADETIKLWSLPDGALQATFVNTEWVHALAISPDGKLLAFESKNDIKLWVPPDGAPRATLTGHAGHVNALAISPDGKLLASGDGNGTLRLWTLPDGNAVGCLLDLAALTGEIKGATYEAKDTSGKAVTYTLPCGSAIPAGAVCTCNCVGLAGSCSCVGDLSGGTHYWYPN